jgi:hypothetical protein
MTVRLHLVVLPLLSDGALTAILKVHLDKIFVSKTET